MERGAGTSKEARLVRFKNPTADEQQQWLDWVASRPESIREAATRFDLWTLYRLKSTGQRVYLTSFSEPDTGGKVMCRVEVTGEFNLLTHERSVFGIAIDDLEECDLPSDTEVLGSFDFPIDVLKDLMKNHPNGAPPAVMQSMLARYPLRNRP